MPTKIKIKKMYIASDHAGYNLKNIIKKYVIKKGIKVIDIGPNNDKRVDYPDFAHLLSKKIKNKDHYGILVCGSGIGMSITANRHKNIRAALCYDIKSTILSRQHNNANVISIGARLTKKNVALRCVSMFIKTSFDGGRHNLRIKKI